MPKLPLMRNTIILSSLVLALSFDASSMERNELIEKEYNELKQMLRIDREVEEYRIKNHNEMVGPFEYKRIALDKLIADENLAGTPLAEKYKSDLLKGEEAAKKQVDQLTHVYRQRLRIANQRPKK